MQESRPDWYGIGWVFCDAVGASTSEYLPPLADQEAQRDWLAGFMAARIDQPETPHWGISEARSGWFTLKGRLEKEFPAWWRELSLIYLSEPAWAQLDPDLTREFKKRD